MRCCFSVVPLHLKPFTVKDLEQLSLSERISRCPQLADIRLVYPDIAKDRLLLLLDEKRETPRMKGPYIFGEIIMVVNKTSSVIAPPSVPMELEFLNFNLHILAGNLFEFCSKFGISWFAFQQKLFKR